MDASTLNSSTPSREPAAYDAQRRIAALEKEIQALRQRDAEWQRRERDLTDFVDKAIVGLHKVGGDGTILWANPADWELLGYTREEYIGHNISEFHADQDLLCGILDQLLAGATLHEQPAVLKCKDGSVRHVLISSNSHFEDGKFVNTRCFTRDVTQQRLTEAALREARLHLAAIVESSDDAIIAVDLTGRITSWNQGAARLYGYTREEIVGKPIHILIPPELHKDERTIVDDVRMGARIDHYETQRLRKDGTRVDISLTVSPVCDDRGNLIGVSKVGRDISERKRAERELSESARRKDEFLAILAHELRNPLAPIRYALAASKLPHQTPEQRRRADEVIERQVEQMARLLDDLLDVSRIARGHVELRRRWIDLTSVVGAAIDGARPLIDAKRHELVLDLPREPLRMSADPVRITQILSNLLNNAAKYTDRGGQIELRARRAGADIVLSVRDNGMGISADMMPKVFTLFAQAKPALQRSEGGLGVGLSLVKAFAELHGGRVEARSGGPGQGSEFIVRLPIGTDSAQENSPSADDGAAARRSLRILVADDNADNVETCALLLQTWGHDVRVAHSGREAVEVAASFKPEVALLDIGMPQMNGYQVARALRAMPWGATCRLVAVTGWGQDDDKTQAAESGFDEHLTKPVDPATLEPLLERGR